MAKLSHIPTLLAATLVLSLLLVTAAQGADLATETTVLSAGRTNPFVEGPDSADSTIYLPAVIQMIPNYALQFDGIDDFASIADKGDFDFDDAFTVEAWFKPLSMPTYGAFHSSIGLVLGTEMEPPISMQAKTGWGLTQDLSYPPTEYNIICFWVGDVDNVSHKGMCLGPLATGRWDHVAGTYEAEEIHMYYNGERDTYPRTTQPNVAPVNFVLLGSMDRPTTIPVPEYFHGLIDEVRIWNVARTQAQIRADMNRTLTGNEPGLVGYWRFDEGSGQAILDASPHHNDGRLGTSVGSDPQDPLWVPSDAPIH